MARLTKQKPGNRENLKNKTAQEVFGSLDAMKVLSCMTLFNEVASDDLFQQVIDHYYQGKVDEITKRKLE